MSESSMRIPNFPGTYIPGSTVIAIFFPSFVPEFADTAGASCTSSPIPCPVECMNCFPNPSLIMYFLHASSTLLHKTPGFAAFNPSLCDS